MSDDDSKRVQSGVQTGLKATDSAVDMARNIESGKAADAVRSGAKVAGGIASEVASQLGEEEAARAIQTGAQVAQTAAKVAKPIDEGQGAEAASAGVGGASAAATAALNDNPETARVIQAAEQATQTATQAGRTAEQASQTAAQVTQTSAQAPETPAPQTNRSNAGEESSQSSLPMPQRAQPEAESSAEAESDQSAREQQARESARAHERIFYELYVGQERTEESSWKIHRYFAVEEIGRPYSIVLDLLNEDMFERPEELLGQKASVAILRGARERRIHGVIREVELGGSNSRAIFARVVVVPAMAILACRKTSRIFQEMNVLTVIGSVIRDGIFDYHENYEVTTHHDEVLLDLPIRENLTQYQETDLDFIHRLIEDFGLSYHFIQDEESERVVVSNGGYPAVETLDKYGEDTTEIRFVGQTGEVQGIETIFALTKSRRLRPTSIVLQDYDFTTLTEKKPFITLDRSGEDEMGRNREWFDHERHYVFYEYDKGNGYYANNDAKQTARLRMAEWAVEESQLEGRSYVTGLSAGHTITVVNHPNADLDQTYLVTKVVHQGVSPEARTLFNESDDETSSYENQFWCTPFDPGSPTPFRHGRKTPRPRIHGVQNAFVVGESESNALNLDMHGRVQVQFGWDRLAAGPSDDREVFWERTESYWLRVMQPWGGPGFGAFFHPRIGSEVLVSFVNGDPDRPVVIGSVYNQLHPYPASANPIEEHATVTGFRTRSVPHNEDSDEYNEFVFDDASGNELIRMHAQKDHRVTVLNDESISVGHDQTLTVKRDRTHTVERHENIAITGSQKISITGDGTHDDQEVEGAQLDITGAYKVDASKRIDVQAPEEIVFKCGDSVITMTPTSIELKAGDGASFKLTTDVVAKSKEGSGLLMASHIVAESKSAARLTMDSNAKLEVLQGANLELSGIEGKLVGGASAQVVVDVSAKMEGLNAEVTGKMATKVSGFMVDVADTAGNSVSLSAAGANMTGASMVNIKGGTVGVTGGIVTIN